MHYFEGSGRLLALSEGNLVYSQDHGTTWKESRDIDSYTPIETIMKDRFFTSRAFVTGPNVSYVTEDYGESWQKMDIPSSNVSNFGLPFFKTHPSNRNYIIAVKTACYAVSSGSENGYGPPKAHFPKCKSVLLFSKDGGKTFAKITLPGHDSLQESFGGASCNFIRGKRASQQNDDSTFLCQAHNSSDTTGARTNHILFSVSNLGKTTNKVDQLDGLVVDTIEILESYAVVVTREDINNYYSAKRI